MTALVPFDFEQSAIRVVEIDGRPWFAGRDVAAAPGYANDSDALRRHTRGVAKRYPIVDGLGRTQEISIISEADVMRLIVRSRLPAAERFERWVFEEVLPQIARTGRYGPADPMAALQDPETLRGLLLTFSQRAANAERLVAEQAPKVEGFDRIAEARGALCLTDAAKALQVRRCDLITWMQEHTWIHKRTGTNWLPYQTRIQQGVLTLKVVTRTGADGVDRIFDQMLVTPKGLTRLAELIKQRPYAAAGSVAR